MVLLLVNFCEGIFFVDFCEVLLNLLFLFGFLEFGVVINGYILVNVNGGLN